MAQDNAATGGMLVILGIVVAIGVAILLYKGNLLTPKHSGPTINVEVTRPAEAPSIPAQ